VAEEGVKRKLAAIVAADIVGYSRLMEADEAGTLAQLKALRKELIDPKVAEHNGRVFKTTGDGILIEFGSVTGAVTSSVEIQEAIAKRNDSVPEDRRIQFRVGVNLGEIIIEGDDIYGDGVNVAARIEGLAESGGICVSGDVYHQVNGKVGAEFDDLGEKTLKNIRRPVRIYRVAAAPPASGQAPQKSKTLPLPDRPSIAVLPFENLSGDPEQEYFADGIAEDVLTALARFRWFLVIARNSSFTYKHRNVDIRQVGRELGVRYVLEGSVRKAGDRLRITGQLIEAATGGHLWAEKYDGTTADVFDLQDRITEGVVGAIEPSIRQAEIERAKRKRPDNLDAYDLYLRALEHAATFTQSGQTSALSLLDAAIALDPDYAEAHGLSAWCRQQRFLWGGRKQEDRDAALRHAEAVAAARSDDGQTLALAAFAKGALARDFEAAFAMLDRALALNPSCAMAHNISAVLNMVVNRPDRGRDHAERSLRLSPFDPLRYLSEIVIASANLVAGQTETALADARRGLEVNPAFPPGLTVLTLALVRLGRIEEARLTMRRLLELSPDTSLATLSERLLFFDTLGADRVVAELQQAGLPG